MKLKRLAILAAIMLSAVNPENANAETRSITITDPNEGHQIFTDALNAKKLDVLVDIYADDAVMVAAGGKEIRGRKAIREFFAETIKSIESIKLDTVFRLNYTDTVVFRSKYTVVFNTADGKKVSQSTSGIEVERKQPDGNWLFIVDHHFGGADYVDFLKLSK